MSTVPKPLHLGKKHLWPLDFLEISSDISVCILEQRSPLIWLTWHYQKLKNFSISSIPARFLYLGLRERRKAQGSGGSWDPLKSSSNGNELKLQPLGKRSTSGSVKVWCQHALTGIPQTSREWLWIIEICSACTYKQRKCIRPWQARSKGTQDHLNYMMGISGEIWARELL